MMHPIKAFKRYLKARQGRALVAELIRLRGARDAINQRRELLEARAINEFGGWIVGDEYELRTRMRNPMLVDRQKWRREFPETYDACIRAVASVTDLQLRYPAVFAKVARTGPRPEVWLKLLRPGPEAPEDA